MGLKTQRRQLAAKAGTPGQYSTTVEDPEFARATLMSDAAIRPYTVNLHEQDFARESFGTKDAVVGARFGEMRFSIEAASGIIPGDDPPWGLYLEACGFSKTVDSGSASLGTLAEHSDPFFNAGGATAPTLGGAYTGTENAQVHAVIRSIIADTSFVLEWRWYPTDASAAEFITTTHTDATTETPASGSLAGVTLAFPDGVADTSKYRVGDTWTFFVSEAAAVSVTYIPISKVIPVLDLAFYNGGRLFTLHSCAGDWTFSAGVGQVSLFGFVFRGVINTVEDRALLAGISHFNTTAAKFINVPTFTLGGTPVQPFENFGLAGNNTVTPVECATATTGYDQFGVAKRAISGTLDPKAALLATANPFADWFAGTTEALAVTLAGGAGQIITFAAPRLQKVDVADQERDAFDVDALQFRLNEPQFDAGDNYEELTIVAK